METAGYSLKDVIQSTVYLSSMGVLEEFNREYSKYFETDYPSRTTVSAGLRAGALIEVSIVAYKE